MNIWGSIPDWLNVVIAFLALIGFNAFERKKLLVRRQSVGKKEGTSDRLQALNNMPDNTLSMAENTIEFRVELYSRILIGVIFGLALGPIYSWIFSALQISESSQVYSSWNTIQTTTIVLSAIALSLIFSFVYWRFTPRWDFIFVYWVERLIISLLGFWLIFGFIFITRDYGSDAESYYLFYEPIINVIVSIILLLLIGFPSTPVDWIIESRRRKIENNDIDRGKSRN